MSDKLPAAIGRKNARITISRVVLPDIDGETPDSVGVIARAEIAIPYGYSWITARLDSPGIWDVQGADEEYLSELFEDEKQTLLAMLDSLKTYEVR